ncbi:MAG: hypothetical protein CMQ20_02105 [Gammaproteobacteria bacterium]|nr:hypothetical protein [Gammaproteobacteria bacterium]
MKPEEYQRNAEQIDHLFGVKFLVMFAAFLIVAFTWPQPYDLIKELISKAEQVLAENPSAGPEVQETDNDQSTGFDEQLAVALRYERTGDRPSADRVFRELLKRASASPDYLEKFAVLLPRAADFYNSGSEIQADQIEDLYRDAIIAIEKVYGDRHHDYENVYRGLEKHYQSQGRYNDAATQTRLLLEFYHEYYSDNEDMLVALIKPTTIRLGHNLLAGGEKAAARKAYQAALRMDEASNQPNSVIKEFIHQTYREAADIRRSVEEISLDGITIERFQENDDSISIVDYADSNKTVAEYLRQIQRKAGDPHLDFVRREDNEKKPASAFSITIDK